MMSSYKKTRLAVAGIEATEHESFKHEGKHRMIHCGRAAVTQQWQSCPENFDRKIAFLQSAAKQQAEYAENDYEHQILLLTGHATCLHDVLHHGLNIFRQAVSGSPWLRCCLALAHTCHLQEQ